MHTKKRIAFLNNVSNAWEYTKLHLQSIKIQKLYVTVNYTINTARKTVFQRPWNLMESSKRTSKYYLFIFSLKKDRFSHHCKSQNKNFSVATNKNFSVISKYHISINFLSPKKDRISNHGKVQNKNFSVTSKYHLSINFLSQKDRIFQPRKVWNKNISVISKYHLSTNFLSQKRPYFTFSKSSKQELFSNQYIYFHQLFGSKKTVCIIPEKFKTRSLQQSVSHVPC